MLGQVQKNLVTPGEHFPHDSSRPLLASVRVVRRGAPPRFRPGPAEAQKCKNFEYFFASPRKILPQLLRLASVSLPRESARGWRQGPGVGRELCSIFEVDINYGFCIVLHANFEY